MSRGEAESLALGHNIPINDLGKDVEEMTNVGLWDKDGEKELIFERIALGIKMTSVH